MILPVGVNMAGDGVAYRVGMRGQDQTYTKPNQYD